jgi:hypothetical protein
MWPGRFVPVIRLTRVRVLIPCVVILTYSCESVGSHLGTSPNFLPYKYKGVRSIENHRTHYNRTNLLFLIYHSCIRSWCSIALVVASHPISSYLFDCTSSRGTTWVAYQPQDGPIVFLWWGPSRGQDPLHWRSLPWPIFLIPRWLYAIWGCPRWFADPGATYDLSIPDSLRGEI